MRELAVFIDNASKEPVYEQIYSYIRNEIIDGRINTGEKLPSSRELSLNLQVSRSTVLYAYDQLVAEGYIESRPQKGYYVAEIEKGFGSDKTVEKNNIFDVVKNKPDYLDFTPNGIETAYFPFGEWKKYSKQIFTPEMKELFNSGNPKGDKKIRELLVDFLSKSRGVKANSEQVIIGSGNENLLNILNSIIPDEIKFAVENPVYQKSYAILKSLSKEVYPINLDEYGLDVEELRRVSAEVVYVTPSHQYPLGIVMSIKRRMELLNWAYEKEGRYIIEDDYDSEFRYKGRPIPSLQSIDTEGKVIYIGTFSKSVSPAIRMSYMVLPKKLIETIDSKEVFFSNTVSRIDQKYMEFFIESGAFERHLNRMRTIYKGKHEVILDELKKWKKISITGENAGAHIIVTINNGMTEKELVEKARKNGVRVYPLSEYYLAGVKTKDATVIIGFAKLSTDEIKAGLEKLKKVWML